MVHACFSTTSTLNLRHFFLLSRLKLCEEDRLGASGVAIRVSRHFVKGGKRKGEKEKTAKPSIIKPNQSFNPFFHSCGGDVFHPPACSQTKHRHSLVKRVQHKCSQKAKNWLILISIATPTKVSLGDSVARGRAWEELVRGESSSPSLWGRLLSFPFV